MTWWTRLKLRVSATKREVLWRTVHWGWREFQQAGLVTADTPGGRAFRRFGDGSIMAFPPGAVFGEGGIEVGDDTLGRDGQDAIVAGVDDVQGAGAIERQAFRAI